jgi:phosphoglycolate phosphatase-like HAD superfamily hydrolase
VLRQIRLLVFDLDYLIYDCAAIKVRALRESMISFADAIPHDVRLPDAADTEEGFRDYGCRWSQMLQIGLDEERLAELQSAYRVHEERLVTAGLGRIYPGLPELLLSFRRNGLLAAIGAEANRDYLLAVSDRHSLESVFEMAYCAEEFGAGGTDEMIDEIMNRAEVNRSETLALGTRPEFFRSAHNLEVLTIGCGWGLRRHEALDEADFQALTVDQAYPAIENADALAAQYFS